MTGSYEHELTANRDEIAAVLEGLADDVRSGEVQLGEGGDAVTVSLPDAADLEIELETEDDEVSLEVELEWDSDAADVADVDDSEEAVETVDTTDTDATAEAEESTPAESPTEAQTVGETDTEGASGVADDLVTPVGAAAPVQSLARFEVFRDRAEEWRWRLRHRNGNVIATSGEGYTRKHNALKGLRSVMGNAPGAELVDEG